jgi:hypothetical protein
LNNNEKLLGGLWVDGLTRWLAWPTIHPARIRQDWGGAEKVDTS